MVRKATFVTGIVTTLALSLTIILFSIELTVLFKPLYYADISILNIEKLSNMSRGDIIKNYDYLINYSLNSKDTAFKLPTLPSSEGAVQHFYEVKLLFNLLHNVLLISAFISLIGFIYCHRNKFFRFYKWTSVTLLSTCIFLALVFSINFDNTFIIFHKIFFKNSLWLFDPSSDPVINILPETFFLHCGILIAALILLLSGGMYLKYRNVNINSKYRD